MHYSYEGSGDKGESGYDDIFLAYLERLVRDLDKKVERGKDRLRRSAQAKQEVPCDDIIIITLAQTECHAVSTW